MLIEFYGQNFGCFRDEFRLSMLATDVDPGSERGIVEVKVEGDEEPLRLLRAAAIYGPNGSGKSTVVRAAERLERLISRSASFKSDEPIPGYEPFARETTRPVRLGIGAVIHGQVYKYDLEFDGERFLSERLVRSEVRNETVLFERTGQKVEGEWSREERFALIAQDFRANALVLSLADRFTPGLAKDVAVGLRRLLRVDDGDVLQLQTYLATHLVQANSEFASWLLAQLQAADLGIVEIGMEKRKWIVGKDHDTGKPVEESRDDLLLRHQGAERPFDVPYYFESGGTKRLVGLAPMLYDLSHGGAGQAVFVDELDASLHPELLRGLIAHFNCDISLNGARGQLIFVAHETSLLDEEAKDAVLRRDQVYLTEKGNDGAARLYSVAEFKERNNLNLRRRYLQGRYGALPALGTFGD